MGGNDMAEKVRRMNIAIEPEQEPIWNKAKSLAFEHGISLKQFVIDAMLDHIQKLTKGQWQMPKKPKR
jgi:hypothetical protein